MTLVFFTDVAFTLVVSLLFSTFPSFFTAVFVSFLLEAARAVELTVLFEDFVVLASSFESVYSSGSAVFSIPV